MQLKVRVSVFPIFRHAARISASDWRLVTFTVPACHTMNELGRLMSHFTFLLSLVVALFLLFLLSRF